MHFLISRNSANVWLTKEWQKPAFDTSLNTPVSYPTLSKSRQCASHWSQDSLTNVLRVMVQAPGHQRKHGFTTCKDLGLVRTTPHQYRRLTLVTSDQNRQLTVSSCIRISSHWVSTRSFMCSLNCVASRPSFQFCKGQQSRMFQHPRQIPALLQQFSPHCL